MAICIAASICASAAVYFLLRSRMSVLEDTVATLCRAVQETSVAQQRVACMSIPEGARTGAAIVKNIIAKPDLIPVSDDDDDSSYITTSDEEEDEPNSGPLKTVTLTGGGSNSIVGADLSSIITSITGSGEVSSTGQLAVEHISREENHDQSSSESESDSENDSESDNDGASAGASADADQENSGAKEGGSDSLEGYDFTKYKVPELRAFVVQYHLAPNPTKLRKGELLDLLIEAQAS